MDKIEQIKQLIAPFIDKTAGDIGQDTPLDRSAIPGSVLIHRMYGVLANNGYVVDNFRDVHTFSDLLAALQLAEKRDRQPSAKPAADPLPRSSATPRVGIDMENISSMPRVDDYRQDGFYKETFSAQEISECILAADPRSSFAGKFAAKEAIVKADNAFAGVPFSQIEILNDKNGRPCFSGFLLSVSHTPEAAVAVAFKPGTAHPTRDDLELKLADLRDWTQDKISARPDPTRLAVLASLLSVAAFVLFLIKLLF